MSYNLGSSRGYLFLYGVGDLGGGTGGVESSESIR